MSKPHHHSSRYFYCLLKIPVLIILPQIRKNTGAKACEEIVTWLHDIRGSNSALHSSVWPTRKQLPGEVDPKYARLGAGQEGAREAGKTKQGHSGHQNLSYAQEGRPDGAGKTLADAQVGQSQTVPQHFFEREGEA